MRNDRESANQLRDEPEGLQVGGSHLIQAGTTLTGMGVAESNPPGAAPCASSDDVL